MDKKDIINAYISLSKICNLVIQIYEHRLNNLKSTEKPIVEEKEELPDDYKSEMEKCKEQIDLIINFYRNYR